GQQQGKTAAARRALSQRNDRLRALPHQLHHGRYAALRAPHMLDLALRSVILPRANIKSCTKCPALCPEKHSAHILAVLKPAEIGLEREDHLFVHGVELV